MYVTMAVVICPICGALFPVAGVVLSGEPLLAQVKCQQCKTDLQITKDALTGKIVAERVKAN